MVLSAAVLSAVLGATLGVALDSVLNSDLSPVLGSAADWAMACTVLLPRSTVTSSGPGVKPEGGPSGFGERTAVERSRPRNSWGRYSSATDRPLHTSTVTQPRVMKAF